MIKIETNADEIAQKFARFRNEFPRNNREAIKDAQMMGVRIARRIAPQKSGDLKEGIRRKPIIVSKGSVSGSIISTVPKSFPYHFWINEEPGYETVSLPTTRNFSKSGPRKPVRHANTRRTGATRYWDLTRDSLQKIYPKLVIKKTNDSLKKSFR